MYYPRSTGISFSPLNFVLYLGKSISLVGQCELWAVSDRDFFLCSAPHILSPTTCYATCIPLLYINIYISIYAYQAYQYPHSPPPPHIRNLVGI